MRVFQHPAFPDIATNCTHIDGECDHVAKGWVPLLNDEEWARFEEIELEAELTPTIAPEE